MWHGQGTLGARDGLWWQSRQGSGVLQSLPLPQWWHSCRQPWEACSPQDEQEGLPSARTPGARSSQWLPAREPLQQSPRTCLKCNRPIWRFPRCRQKTRIGGPTPGKLGKRRKSKVAGGMTALFIHDTPCAIPSTGGKTCQPRPAGILELPGAGQLGGNRSASGMPGGGALRKGGYCECSGVLGRAACQPHRWD